MADNRRKDEKIQTYGSMFSRTYEGQKTSQVTTCCRRSQKTHSLPKQEEMYQLHRHRQHCHCWWCCPSSPGLIVGDTITEQCSWQQGWARLSSRMALKEQPGIVDLFRVTGMVNKTQQFLWKDRRAAARIMSNDMIKTNQRWMSRKLRRAASTKFMILCLMSGPEPVFRHQAH